jgi:alkanesulfonate monooxygenase SsuD/methylene tetrahydromethanopterin reductase-like flavin-dependent oxidoreductase (luciferase family)
LAGVAATTSRIELGPLVSCTAYRNPALIAKAAATVDEMSSGRLVLGLGGGYFDAEFRALGISAKDRVGRFGEAIAIIHDLLRGDSVDREGRHHTVRDFAVGLPQVRPNGPPLLVGATKPRMMQLTARHADLWNAWLPFSIDPIGDFRAMQKALDRACIDEGRDPGTLGRTVTVAVGLLDRTVRYGPHEMNPIGHDTEEIVGVLEQLRSERVDHVQLCLAPATAVGIEALAPVLQQLGRSS